MVSNAKVDSLATGCLKGTVTDEKTGEELPFVNVIVKQNGKLVSGGTTDFDGVYIIKPLREGTYDIEMATVGYQSYKRTGVKVLSTGFTMVDVQLHPTATALEEVQIVEEKVPMIEIGSPESGKRISSDDIQRMPGNSVESIVAAVVPIAPVSPPIASPFPNFSPVGESRVLPIPTTSRAARSSALSLPRNP